VQTESKAEHEFWEETIVVQRIEFKTAKIIRVFIIGHLSYKNLVRDYLAVRGWAPGKKFEFFSK